jgi:D-glycero-alpha-D-manno-heptose-7-phosphate kinase
MTKVHCKAPLRLGLAGGGTDVAPYSELFGGHVLNAAISLFTHCHIETIDGPTEFKAADFDLSYTLGSTPRSDGGPSLQLHEAVHYHIVDKYLGGKSTSLKVTTYSDAPPGSGVGTSSGLVVAMVKAYAELFQLPLGEYDVAHIAFEIERIECSMAGGKQDQYAATFGGFNFMEFGANDRVVVNPLRLRRDVVNELETRLLLFFTGRSRSSAAIIASQAASALDNASEELLAMHNIKISASTMKEALLRGRIDDVLEILGASWAVKKRAANNISNPHIDSIADAATAAGARGLKISGAGGGGFMMIAVDAPKRHNVIRSLKPFGGQFFPFNFVEHGAQSWKII